VSGNLARDLPDWVAEWIVLRGLLSAKHAIGQCGCETRILMIWVRQRVLASSRSTMWKTRIRLLKVESDGERRLSYGCHHSR
jgi:hypothetical protein